jgi:hypothetical protein
MSDYYLETAEIITGTIIDLKITAAALYAWNGCKHTIFRLYYSQNAHITQASNDDRSQTDSRSPARTDACGACPHPDAGRSVSDLIHQLIDRPSAAIRSTARLSRME